MKKLLTLALAASLIAPVAYASPSTANTGGEVALHDNQDAAAAAAPTPAAKPAHKKHTAKPKKADKKTDAATPAPAK